KVKELDLAGTDHIHLVKEGAGWRMAEPGPAPADTREVESVLTSLAGLEVDEVVGDTVTDLAQYGLATPKTTVKATVEGAPQPLTLVLGDKTPDGAGVYAKTGASPRVFTVAAYHEGALAKKPFDLRDRDVLHFKQDAAAALDVTGPDGSYSLAADGSEWKIVRPVATRAGRWSVDGLVGALAGLRMESVAAETAEDVKPYGLVKPERTVRVGLKDGSARTLELGGKAGEKTFYAREAGSKQVVVIPGAIVDDLAKGLAELRAKRLLEVATYEVTSIEAQAGATKRSYLRSSEKDKEGIDVYKWKRTAPDTASIDTNKVQDALFAVGGLEVQEFLDAPGPPASYGLDAPALRVSLKYEDAQKPMAWFEVGQKDGTWYARRVDDSAVLKLDPAKAAALVKSFSEL
ncbi:MAG TPA: DUF4340 domain-containing protein, partial [Vicinamibacteria bacterium]|nr:DUF4340 domain-containing protein [Vicinamibacteria bacterium]